MPDLIHPDTHLLRDLSSKIDATLSALIKPGQRVALVNFPNHANAGDSALWLGQVLALKRAGATFLYHSSWASYRRDELARILKPDDLILINGGGNFGDLYPLQQAATRLRLLRDFPAHRIIQLPQSIWFIHPENRDEVKRLCEAHRDFTLLVRDQQSLDEAKKHFNVPSQLCPDMAFALGPLPRPVTPSLPILWLARQDPESTGYTPPHDDPDIQVIDWLGSLPEDHNIPLASRLACMMNPPLHRRSMDPTKGTPRERKLLAATFHGMARYWIHRGCCVLAKGHAVVTDRLHGHILCLLMGIPHVILDNSYGKLRSLHQTWTRTACTASWSNDPKHAADLARSLRNDLRA
ncbi:MAG TPA: polysaccharide pyruvyl transferase family protein [Kiritimatiellia bacterium]|nr:polysaccharide pyruvyl transferase family protein [Kiritimatiellia bacterium]